MSKNPILFLQGALYTIIGTLTPAVAVLSGTEPLTTRGEIALAVTCVIAGATALKAFLSTSYSDHKNTLLRQAQLAARPAQPQQ